jgi:transcriptional regulator with XRE-family HTH domain
MTGIAFIANVFKASYTDIAKKLGLTTSTVADWASGRRPIPSEKLSLLSKLFRIDEEYFRKKELSDVEKIKVEINYLERIAKRDSFTLEETVTDFEGVEHQVYTWHNPYDGDLRFKYEALAREELLQRIRGILHHDEYYELVTYRSKNHYHIYRQTSDLLELDGGELDEEISKEETEERKKVSLKENALGSMLQFLNGGHLLDFGENDAFHEALFHLLREHQIIDAEPPIKIEREEIFDQVDPKYKK